jgi:hypothetical protein
LRVLALVTAAACAIAGGACSNLLGIDDPTPDFGGDGGPRALVSISIGPAPLELPLGVSQQLTATGTFDDGSSDDITAQVEFAVEEGATLTVTPTGLARAVAQGPTTLAAKLGRIAGNATARVGPAVPDRLVFSIGDFKLAQLQRVRLRVLAVMTDDTMQDATANATYASDAPAIANVSAPGAVDGGSQAGAATISASLGPARPGTVKATVSGKQCRPVINELQAHGAALAADEWIEVLNPCTVAVNVDGWVLVYRGPNTVAGADSNLMMTLAGQLAPGEIKLFAGVDFPGANDGKWTNSGGIMGQNNGAVALRMSVGGLIADAVSYGTVLAGHPFTEATALPAMTNGRSAQRLPFDGHDDDDGATDFMQVATPSPRAPNVP